MKPLKTDCSQDELFKRRLSSELNPRHELFILSSLIPWEAIEEEFGHIHNANSLGGQPPKPVRLMVGLMLLQYMHNLSNDLVVKRWVENPYWQYFCGYDHFQWNFPIDPSSLSRWRDRLGTERLESILKMSVKVAVETGTVKSSSLEEVSIDTTVMPKNIEYPTDCKLLEKARKRMVNLSKEHGVVLRQNYNLLTKKLIRKIGGYLHAKQMKRARKAMKKLKTYVGRVMRDCSRKIAGNKELEQAFAIILSQTAHLLTRKTKDKKKLYSLHEPKVDCISKGKAHKRYEFGCKVSLAVTNKEGLILSSEALHGNPFDGHTLKRTLSLAEEISGIKIKNAFVDKGYKGHEVEDCNVYISGQRRGVSSAIKKKLKRRQAIEPRIGHMKSEVKLGLSRLKGVIGDQMNAILAGAAYNLKMILRRIRSIFVQILYLVFGIFCIINA